jgi:DNA-binding response OmpR family regulator
MAVPQTRRRVHTILVVEDDQAVAGLIGTVLNAVPEWAAVVAYDAYGAFDVVEHLPVDLVIMDVNLPSMTGPELLRQLRREPGWTDPPVIMMSAVASQPELSTTARDVPFDAFLPKPFDVDDLVAVARRALRRAPSRTRARAA